VTQVSLPGIALKITNPSSIHLNKSSLAFSQPDKDRNGTSSEAQDDAYYYPNCDCSVWMRSCEHEVIEPLKSAAVRGSIPKWLKGSLLRNGPGSLKVGEYRYQHLFDSFALLHKYVPLVGIS